MAGKSVLEGLEKSIKLLIEDNRRLRDEAVRLRETSSRSREENKRLAERVKELDQKLTVRELAGVFGKDTAKMDRLIREVDQCIKLLNR